MYFSFTEHDSELVGELLYIQSEYSLCYSPYSKNAGISILCGEYTGLDAICETGVVTHISGYNSKHVWLPMKLDMPKAKKAELVAHFDDPPLRGTGIDYNRNWYTYYDNNSQCICIGDPNVTDNDVCVEFANRIIAVLRGNDLIAIWAKIREV